MIAIFPESTLSTLTPVVLLGRAPRDQLHTAGNLTATPVFHKEVDVIGGHDVIENAQPKALPPLEQPMLPTFTFALELEQESPLVAAVSDVPDALLFPPVVR